MVEDTGNILRTISQIGVVVRDMDKFIEKMELLFGKKPVNVVKLPNETMKNKEIYYYGELSDSTILLAFYRFGQLELEAIQPLTGKSIFQDFLDKKGEGIHHIRFSVDNLAEADRHLGKLGAKKMQSGFSTRNVDGLQWAFYDTESLLGFFVEIFNEYENSR